MINLLKDCAICKMFIMVAIIYFILVMFKGWVDYNSWFVSGYLRQLKHKMS